MTLGEVDYHLYHPWYPRERILYPAISDFLASWDKSQDAAAVAVQIVGEQTAAHSHELRDALTRVGLPYWFHDHGSTAGQQVLSEAGVAGAQLPVLLFRDGTVLIAPTLAEVWRVLGLRTSVASDACDVAVVGGGPAGLAAAVYASSEGLATLLLEQLVPGGQAGTSSLIRNYLGFHRGVSGEDLATFAVEQAWLFGTNFVLSQSVTGLRADGQRYVVTTADGSEVSARAVVLATGVTWRRLGVPTLEALVGSGVFYGAAGAEARAMSGRDVFLVGAGNSAGQAAMHLSRYAASVTMVVRGESLRSTMSAYLVSEIEGAHNVTVRLRTEVVDGSGACRLQTITLREGDNGKAEVVPADALFLLIGAEPRTAWLEGSVRRDGRGYLLTGQDLLTSRDRPAWTLARAPMHLETSMPGVFAVGDVRHQSVKRVAAAVGEGSTAIQLVHTYLNGSGA